MSLNMSLKTAPTEEPIQVSELLDQIHMDYEDELPPDYREFERIIVAARKHAEMILDRALLTQTWEYYLDAFPRQDAFYVPKGNLVTVASVAYKDQDGTSTTMTVNTEYLVETNDDQLGRIVLPYGVSWPSTTLYPSKPITVNFTCGWTSSENIPEDIRHAILMIGADLWEFRSRQVFSNIGMTFTPNPTVMNLLNDHRLCWGSM